MKTKYALLAVMFMGLPLISSASTVSGYVSQVRVDNNGLGIITFDQTLSGLVCGFSFPNSLAFDATSNSGKMILAAALSAKAASSPVVAYGTGTCAIYGGYVEDTSYLSVN